MARCIHSQSLFLFDILCGSAAGASSLLLRSPAGVISLRDPLSCANEYDSLQAQHVANQQEEHLPHRHGAARGHSLIRMASRWSPFNKRIYLAAVEEEMSDKVIASGSQTRAEALAQFWQPQFSSFGHPDRKRADDFLSSYARRWPIDVSTLTPTVQDYENFISCPKLSFPGPDGIPFIAYKAAGTISAVVLEEVGGELRSGRAIGYDFNFSSLVFAPKGERNSDSVEVVRKASETRPISLQNCDRKIIAAVHGRKLTPAMMEGACPSQRGFAPKRTLTQNVIDLDIAARRSDCFTRLPALVGFDFKAAFPSVWHGWIRRVLHAIGPLRGFSRYSLPFTLALRRSTLNSVCLLPFAAGSCKAINGPAGSSSLRLTHSCGC